MTVHFFSSGPSGACDGLTITYAPTVGPDAPAVAVQAGSPTDLPVADEAWDLGLHIITIRNSDDVPLAQTTACVVSSPTDVAC
jgi:hypothetical protein